MVSQAAKYDKPTTEPKIIVCNMNIKMFLCKCYLNAREEHI